VRARETREQERLDTTNVRILSDAQSSQDRNWPPRRLPLLLALLALGIVASLGLAYFVEMIWRPRAASNASLRARQRTER